MSCGYKRNLSLCTESTGILPILWGVEPLVFRPVTGASATAPLVLEVVDHGMVDGWTCALTGLGGMKELNSPTTPAEDGYFHKVRVIDADHIELSEIDGSLLGTYTSGGHIQYWTAPILSGFTVDFVVTDKRSGAELMRVSTDATPMTVGTVVIDIPSSSTTITIPQSVLESLTFRKADYRLTYTSPDLIAYTMLSGTLTLD